MVEFVKGENRVMGGMEGGGKGQLWSLNNVRMGTDLSTYALATSQVWCPISQ